MNDQRQLDINTILENGYSVDLGAFLHRGWEIFRSNLVLFVVFELFTLGIYLLERILFEVLVRLPFVGKTTSAIIFIISIIIGIFFYSGELSVAFKGAKGQKIVFKDFFEVFKKAYFVKLLMAVLVIGVLILSLSILMHFSQLLFGLIPILVHSFMSGKSLGLEPFMLIYLTLGVLGILGVIYVIYLSVSHLFVIPFVMECQMRLWPAMKTSHKLVHRNWFGILGLELFLGLIFLCGLPFGELGELIANPLAICVIAAAYERIIGFANFDSSQA
jgi:hypothetical protein